MFSDAFMRVIMTYRVYLTVIRDLADVQTGIHSSDVRMFVSITS